MAKDVALKQANDAPIADEAAPEADEAAPPRRSRGKLFALIGLALAAAGGGGAYFAFQDEPAAAPQPASAPKAAAVPRAEAPKPAKPPQYVNLETFTVNLRDDGSAEHYLQVGLVFQVAANEAAEALKLHMPIIRSNILLLLSGKSPGELASVEGKGKLAQELLAAARAPLGGEDPERGIAAVHFSAFIIQ